MKAHPHTLVVQGGSGAIGAALTRALLAQDPRAHVIATGRNVAQLEAKLAAHPEAGRRLELLALDLCDDASISEAAARILGQAPQIDLLIHASGFLHDTSIQPEKRVERLDRQALLRQFEVNAIGPLLVTRALMPGLLAATSPRIAVLSARVGSIDDNRLGGWYGYRASKAALNQLVVTLAREMTRRAPESLCVALHPGTVASPLSRPFAGRRAVFDPELAAKQLLEVLSSLTARDTGTFKAWDGSAIPW